MFSGLLSQLRACSVSVAASGVKLDAGVSICWLKSCPKRSREAETQVLKLFGDFHMYNFINIYVYIHIYIYIYM